MLNLYIAARVNRERFRTEMFQILSRGNRRRFRPAGLSIRRRVNEKLSRTRNKRSKFIFDQLTRIRTLCRVTASSLLKHSLTFNVSQQFRKNLHQAAVNRGERERKDFHVGSISRATRVGGPSIPPQLLIRWQMRVRHLGLMSLLLRDGVCKQIIMGRFSIHTFGSLTLARRNLMKNLWRKS